MSQLYGQLSPLIVETDAGGEVVVLSCGGPFSQSVIGINNLCTVSFTLAVPTLVYIDASGFIIAANTLVHHDIYIIIDGMVSPPDFIYHYPDAGGSASGSGSKLLAAGPHTIENAYFTQTLIIGSADTGTQTIVVRYSK